MHVGNCTDGPAEYKASTSSGTAQAPLELDVWYTLAAHTYNVVTFLGALDITFRVGSQELTPLSDLISSQDAMLTDGDSNATAHSLSLASLVEAT